MLRVCKGEWVDKLPWVPRIDIWYQVNLLRGTLPKEYVGMSLDEIYDSLELAHYYVTPHFYYHTINGDLIDRGLGIYKVYGKPFSVELNNVDRVIRRERDVTTVTYTTPVGRVSCKLVYNSEMALQGMSLAWISEHVIKEPKDFEVIGYIFRNLKLIPRYEEYNDYEKWIGEKGITVAYTSAAAGPMHHIMKFFMDQSDFFLALYDYLPQLEKLQEDVQVFYDQMMEMVSKCRAKIVYFGSNYDEKLTYPPFFEKYIHPYLKKYSTLLHQTNKLLLSHCDGENKGLLSLLLTSGIDVAEAVCVSPMTKISLLEIRKAFKDKITIFGGLPACIFLEESMSDDDFDTFVLDSLEKVFPGHRFILGVSDTLPPNANFDRVKRVNDLVEHIVF
ncbi:MAG: hypothetical protein PWP04_1787 [Candidatus Atribacteria bacterium]|nr:hypothetical protein [Candidatus Atribacteria bacterium]